MNPLLSSVPNISSTPGTSRHLRTLLFTVCAGVLASCSSTPPGIRGSDGVNPLGQTYHLQQPGSVFSSCMSEIQSRISNNSISSLGDIHDIINTGLIQARMFGDGSISIVGHTKIAVQFTIDDATYAHTFDNLSSALTAKIKNNFITETSRNLLNKVEEIKREKPEITTDEFFREMDSNILSLPCIHYGYKIRWQYLEEASGRKILFLECEEIDTEHKKKIIIPLQESEPNDSNVAGEIDKSLI